MEHAGRVNFPAILCASEPSDTFCSVINHPFMERTESRPTVSEDAQKLLMQMTNYRQILLLAYELGAEEIRITKCH